jgi:hypothetical protein
MSKYGYDSNGVEITESIVEELFRIAEQELLRNGDIAKIFGTDNVSVEEDSFNYYATGTAFGPLVEYTINLTINKKISELQKFESCIYNSLKPCPDKNITFDVVINIHDNMADVFIDNSTNNINIEDDYGDFFAKRFEAIYDTHKFKDYIKLLAENDLYDIKPIIANI